MTTREIVRQMERDETMKRLQAVVWHQGRKAHLPVKLRIVGRRVQNASAWQRIKAESSLFDVRRLSAHFPQR